MKYSRQYVLNKIIITFCKLLQTFAIRLEAAAPEIKKGIYLVKSNYGYTIELDGVTLDFDINYSDAEQLRKTLQELRINK